MHLFKIILNLRIKSILKRRAMADPASRSSLARYGQHALQALAASLELIAAEIQRFVFHLEMY